MVQSDRNPRDIYSPIVGCVTAILRDGLKMAVVVYSDKQASLPTPGGHWFISQLEKSLWEKGGGELLDLRA